MPVFVLHNANKGDAPVHKLKDEFTPKYRFNFTATHICILKDTYQPYKRNHVAILGRKS